MMISFITMIRISKATLIFILLLFTLGCGTTTKQSRQLALSLSEKLDDYIKDRRAGIDSLNQSYRSAYSVLLAEQREFTAERLKLQRQESARAMADNILLNWPKMTTYSAISAALMDAREKQLLEIENRSVAIANASRQYIESYGALKLDLEKLEKAKKNLTDLSEGVNARKSTLGLLIMIGTAYNKARKEELK